MRNLVVSMALWICRHLAIDPIEQARLHGGADAVVRGQRWEAFFREEGGLADVLAKLRRGYFEAASGIGHRDDAKLYEFVVADRLARELEREIMQIVVTGKAEFERREYAEREQSARILRAL